jgi:hypothetical protein
MGRTRKKVGCGMTFNGPALYLDGGKRITTHSMISSMRRCANQVKYKYVERLKPRFATARDKPLKRGTWFHALLQEFYAGRSWKKMHEEFCRKYDNMFDEEKEALGNLPQELADMMRSYLWHYGGDKADSYHGWEVIDTEMTLECPWPDCPDGLDLYRCRLDVMYHDEWGLWIGDHKTNKIIPNFHARLLDAASPLYIWCARENGYPVDGFVWNYIRAKVPSKPELAYVGTKREGLSKKAMDTDYPTMVRGLRELGLDPADHKDILRPLYNQRYKHGEVQTSTYFRRDTIDKDDAMIARVVGAAMRTRDRIHDYGWDDLDSVERSNDRSCEWMCGFGGLCGTELHGGDAVSIRRREYRVGDPLDYYHDKADPEKIEVS